MQRVCLVSGGTGGHLMPALVLARCMQQAGHEPVLVTEGRDVERELLRRELPGVAAVELPRSGPAIWSLPMWLLRATIAARRLLRQHGVAGVVSTGGRASLPVALAARSLRLPLFLLEQNAVTGRANRWLLPMARRIYFGLPQVTRSGRADAIGLATGTPLRAGFGTLDRATARRSLGLRLDAPVVLVTGGSQGARVLNDVVPDALVQVATKVGEATASGRRGLQVLHLSGLGNDADVRQRYAAGGRDLAAHVRPVAADMDRLFAAADLVICRGGGTTVAELAAVGCAAILVPYPHHKDRQQWHNARVLERAGAAIVIEQGDLQRDALAELVAGLLSDTVRLAEMGRLAQQSGRLDAAETILADVRRVLEDPAPLAGPRPGRATRPIAGQRSGGVA